MIRYPDIDRIELEARARALKEDWLTNAETRRAALIDAGRYIKGGPSWSHVKPLFMTLQNLKCIYCERPLGGHQAGAGEQDVEHFRPKSSIKAWPPAKRKLAYDFHTGEASATGYHWLAYDLLNYAAACKACNSARKSNYFPISGPRGPVGATVEELNAIELPLLVYPIGNVDDDPEDLIMFEGVLALPKYPSGPKHRRARVTIDFFDLNNRDELWVDRARVIDLLFYTWRAFQIDPDPAIKQAARAAIEKARSHMSPQASCARYYLGCLQSDPAKAWEVFQAAQRLLPSRRS